MKRSRENEGNDLQETCALQTIDSNIECSLPPCFNATFRNYHEYESHYLNNHSNKCLSCGKMFPSEFYLNIHINENHNPFTEIKKSNGEKIYKCFIENCSKFCSSPQKRKLHMIDKHDYPKEFLFSIVNTGLRPGQKSLLKSNH